MLKILPRRSSAATVSRMLSAEGRRELEEIFSGEAAAGLGIRDAVLFGAAECARSRLMASVLEAGQLSRMTALSRASHDAERVVRTEAGGREGAFRWTASNAYLRRCVEDLASEDPERVLRSQLELQPGRFGPGAKEIDGMVDVAQSVPAVVSAQLSGTGAGGCAMMVVKEDGIEPLARALRRRFCSLRNVSPRIEVCAFVEGAGVLEV